MAFQVKLYVETQGEIRRFSLDAGATFSTLQQRVHALTGSESLRLFWQDSEGDLVICGSDDEFNVVKNAHKTGPLRIIAKPGRPDSSKTVHPRVKCDGCGGQVAGTRYKCLECPDFDLCEGCMGEKQHSQHDMLAVRSPAKHDWKKVFAHGFGNREGVRGCPRFARPPCGPCGPCRPPPSGPFAPQCIPPFVRHMMQTMAPLIDNTVEMDIDLNRPLHEVIGDIAKKVTEAVNSAQQPTERQQEEKQATTAEEKKEEQEAADFVTAMASAVADAVNVVGDVLKTAATENGWTHLQAEDVETERQSAEQASTSGTKSEGPAPPTEGKIEAALKAMESMGFPNEGNLLRRLLTNFNGDISRVLDSIH